MTPAASLRPIALFAALAVIVGALVWALRPPPVAVDLVTVQRAPMQVTVSAEGITRVRETWRVTAPLRGEVQRSPVQVGDAVVGGQTVVAVIEPAAPPFLDTRDRRLAEASVTEAQAAVRQAEAALHLAETELTHLQAETARYRALASRGAVAEAALQDAEQAERAARARRDVAISDLDVHRATLARMQIQLEAPAPQSIMTVERAGDTTGDATGQAAGGDSAGTACCLRLTAPKTGIVLHLEDETARLVQAGDPLLTIGDPTDLEIRVDLLSADAVAIAPGTPAQVQRWGGATPLEASVRKIEPSAFTRISALGIEEQRVPLVLDILTPPAQRPGLGDRYRVYVTLVTWSQDDVLQVPQSALFRTAGRWAVFVAEDGRANLRPVQVGRMSAENAQILSGVTAGESVIAYPGAAIEAGTRLRPRTD